MARSEKTVVREMKRIAKSWPKHIELFSRSGQLCLVDKRDGRIIDYIDGIPNDGGDPGVIIKDDVEYMEYYIKDSG